MQKDKLFWIWLSEALGAANRDFKTLISLYDGPYEIFHAEEGELDRIESLSPRTRRRLSDKSLVRANTILDACEKSGIGILTYADPLYPVSLKEIRDPAVLLYYAGNLENFDKTLCVGMVGTRRMSAYGMESAYKIAYELATAGAVVVSGMAGGIDGVSSAAAMAAGGRTIAVLGCGPDTAYPKYHRPLMDEIRKKGLLISEYPPGAKPLSYHFPLRNRLISGLSRATVVVEAGIRSGSLITAKEAILQGRDVFALPANVGSKGAEGTNGLLHDGARLILSARDVLKAYSFVYAATLTEERLSKIEQPIRADLQYLERMGVISLSKRARRTGSEATVRAAEQTEAEQPKSERRASEPTKKQSRRTESESTQKIQDDSRARSVRKELTSSSSSTADLSEQQLSVLRMIPDDRAVSADNLAEQLCELGMPLCDVHAALTILEILGLIQKLPGAMYIKT